MRKLIISSGCVVALILGLAATRSEGISEPEYLAPSIQKTGDSARGYTYLTTGNFLRSGIPYKYFILKSGKDETNYLHRTGENATVAAGFNVVTGIGGVHIVIPTCLQCHAEVFDHQLVVGLGNTFLDFTGHDEVNTNIFNMLRTFDPKSYRAGFAFIRSYRTVYPRMHTEVRGVNIADRLAALLVAHRDPQTLVWHDKPLLDIPDEVYPTDVPAWWLLKKKNAMFYNGFGRGDFSRFLMASNLLTVSDTEEANDVYQHFGDVLAFIRSLQPPKYTQPIDTMLAMTGKGIFNETCSGCHGTYGAQPTYPNLLIPESIIGTDSMLFKSNQQNRQFVDWFNKSWFSQGANPARLVPSNGYVAPPLDGIWITAPYLHNGSVPTLEAVLNSKDRPKYWSRDFAHPIYDYNKVGWKFEARDKPDGKKVYNTTLPGYGNFGHYFGDGLTIAQRKAVIEYLKTL